MAMQIRVVWRKDRSVYDFAITVKGFRTQLKVTLPTKKRQEDEQAEYGDVLVENVQVVFYRSNNTVTSDEARLLAGMLNQACAEIAFWEANPTYEGEDSQSSC